MGLVLYMLAAALITTRPEGAAIILGAAQAHTVGPAERIVQLISSTLTKALGDERVRELRARGADMDWDHVLAYTLTQATEALSELGERTRRRESSGTATE